MTSANHGTSTLEAEILNVSPHGVWILAKDKEHFLDYDQFPWFSEQPIAKIFNVELLHGHHLYWKDLDVDLDLDSIEHPEQYPLVAA